MSAKLTTREFINRAKRKHGDRYNYTKVRYINNITKIVIVCPTHGAFSQVPNYHLSKNGCPSCGLIKCQTHRKYDTSEFVKKAQQMHGNYYNYIETEYKQSNIKVIITCPIHGNFEQIPASHLSGSGCYPCSLEKKAKNNTYTQNEFLNKMRAIFHDELDFSKAKYNNSKTKVVVICTEHGKFERKPSNLFLGRGCHRCSNNNISQPEQNWLDSLNIKNLERQKIIWIDNGKYKPDGYDSRTNTIYEFWGDFWHGNPDIFDPNDINPVNKKRFGELYENTLNKIKMYEDNAYEIVHIWENKYKSSLISKELK